MKIRYASLSQCGRHETNEDSIQVIDLKRWGHWMGIICDGMGGHKNGEVASRIVMETIGNHWWKKVENGVLDNWVEQACQIASTALECGASEPSNKPMGTTMVLASFWKGIVTIAHAGDSRCYLLRLGHYDYDDINNTEKDHVVYQTRDHIQKEFGWDVLTRCFLTSQPEMAVPEVKQFEVKTGDKLFLCSDGVYKCMKSNELKEILLNGKTPEDILAVIDEICAKRSDDNYSAILAMIEN